MDFNWILEIMRSPYIFLLFLPLIGYFCWHHVRDYNNLADCLIALGANGATIFIPNQQIINENLTIPTNITLRIIQGGTLNIGKFSIRNATYKWTSSPSAANEFYLELAAGGDSGIIEPPKIWENDIVMLKGTLGSLAVGEWKWGDNDTLGYNTVYVRIAASADPDSKAVNYVEAGYKVTVRGNVCAGAYQIIEGYGDIDLTYTLTKEIYPEWWGYGGQAEYYKSIFIPKTIFTELPQLLSPDIDCHQGYTTDGTFHYCIDTGVLYKKNAAWANVATNADPFAGGQPQNHLGDGDYYNGKLYIPAETWVDCDNHSNEAIYVFDISDLSRLAIHDISAEGHEVSGLVVVPEHGRNGIIYIVSYCDGTKIWKYDLSDFSYLGTIDLDIGWIELLSLQSITYKNGYFYVSCDDGRLCAIDLDGHVSLIFTESIVGSHEGLDYSQDELRWLIDEGVLEKIHFFIASKDNEQGIKLDEFGMISGKYHKLVKFRASATVNQDDIPNLTATKVILGTEDYDWGANFDNITNYRFTAPYAGFYQVKVQIRYTSVVADKTYYCDVRKNNVGRITSISQSSCTDNLTVAAVDCVQLAKGDYLEVFAYHNAGVGTVDIAGGPQNTFMSVYLMPD